MTRKVNSGLAAALSVATDDATWASAFKTAMGTSRRIVCKKVSNSSALQSTIYASGTTFRDVQMTGEIEIVDGVITSFGTLTNSSVTTAADLLTGAAVLRMEGNGNWVEGTLGLTMQAQTELGVAPENLKTYDFTLNVQPTATNGLGLTSSFSLTRGGGPPIDNGADSPYSVTLQDWSTGFAGEEQTIFFDEDGGSIVWEDAERAADLGVTPYLRSSQTLKIGTGGDAFEFGIHCFKLPPNCNDETNEPVYEFLGVPRPYQRAWVYPMMPGFDNTYDTTIPPPFKMIVKKRDGSVWKVFEGRDGGPVNSPNWSQVRNATQVFRPFYHTKSWLYHSSHRLKLATKARKYNNGVISDLGMRPKMARAMISANSVMASFGTEATQYNGYNFPLASPPNGLTTLATATNGTAPPITDPYLPAINSLERNDTGNDNDGARRPAYALGWKCDEPGALAHNDPYPGPGGQRFDRGYAPSLMLYYLTEPDGVRPQGSVPWRTMCDEYFKGMFHLGHHEVTDARLLQGLDFNRTSKGELAYCRGYYTPGGPIYAPGGEPNHIDTMTLTTASEPRRLDKYGRAFYGYSNMDNQHAYGCPGWYANMFNSVAAAFSQYHRLNGLFLSSGGWGRATANPLGSTGYLLTRQHAWRYLQMGQMWKCSSNHPSMVSRTALEPRWQEEMEYFHDVCVVPATDPTHADYNSIYNQSIRNLGVAATVEQSGSEFYIRATTDAKLLYMFGVMTTGKQMGWYDVLRNKSQKCATAFQFILECVHKYSVERMVATKGRGEGTQQRITPNAASEAALVVPASWTEWGNALAPENGQEDLVTNADGTRFKSGSGPERSTYQHIWQQAVFGFRDFWSELNLPNVDEACAIYQALEDKHLARVTEGTSEDYPWRHPTDSPMAPAIE